VSAHQVGTRPHETTGSGVHVNRLSRCALALGTIAIGVGLAGCGGTSGEVVAHVAGVGTITKGTLDHWIPVEAVIIYEENPAKPLPKGLIPDPPGYSACIAYLATVRQKLVETGSKPTLAKLRSRCVQRYHELKVLTLNTLIGWDWLIGAGTKLGLTASDAEARHRLTEVNQRSFPRAGEFTRYLKLTRQTVADMLFRSKVQLLEVKLKERLATLERPATTQAQRQLIVGAFSNYMPPGKQWAAMTSCRSGYVVSACKEYAGTESPGLPN
jgi:hypothetical protein